MMVLKCCPQYVCKFGKLSRGHRTGKGQFFFQSQRRARFVGSRKKQMYSRKTSTSASLTTLKPLIVWITANCGKYLKDKGIPDHLTCLLRKLYAAHKETELDMEQQTGSKLGKEYNEAVYCHPACLICMQSTCEMPG